MQIGRDDDSTDHGGIVKSILSKTYVNGRLVLTLGAIHYCPEHGPNAMVEASANVFAENLPVCRIGDASACGGRIVTASPDTHANG